jgi:thiol:disulfide interchange protein
VLGQQIGADGWVLASVLFLSMSFFFWLGQSHRKVVRLISVALAALTTIYLTSQVLELQKRPMTSAISQTPSEWQNFAPDLLAELKKKGQPVFIDFTAAWCITCQWNKKSVLETRAVQDLFRKNNVTLIRADWTNYDAQITEALKHYGRNSLPLYVFYRARSPEPTILPQILSTTMIESLFTENNINNKEPSVEKNSL